MVADSFRSEQECCAELALVWKYAKEGKGNYYEVDGYLFRRDKILGESIGQLVISKCRRTEVLKLAHTSVFSSHMGPKKTIERIKYSFFWEGLRADVKNFVMCIVMHQIMGVGCCLIQQDTEGIYRPIAFASQKFNATQKNWASIEKEAWAVSYGLNKFDKWIYGAKVEIISDHNPLST
ncbi:integrase_H2C2 domain-containing protein [Trichonephila clavipes]|nr:integrase_H2C2 domain-containing protein [Trichonephila clavipes]